MSNQFANAFDSSPRAIAQPTCNPVPSRWARARQIAGAIARGALPQSCALCAAPAGDALVCAACSLALPRPGPACPRCALPAAAGTMCGACLRNPPPLSSTIAIYTYAFPVDCLLQRLKYSGALALADWAATGLAQELTGLLAAGLPRPDALVPLPLSPARQRERGFNQAYEIARRVAPPHRHPGRAAARACPRWTAASRAGVDRACGERARCVCLPRRSAGAPYRAAR